MASFWSRWPYLHKGFFHEDLGYVGRGPFSIGLTARDFNPVTLHWFYRPVYLVWISLFTYFAPHSSFAFHAGGLVLFGLTVFLCGALVYRLTRNKVAAVSAAALFLFAPNMEEAIWWISSSSTLGAALGSMVAIHAWISWRDTGKHRFYAAALTATVLAMCSKEDAAGLPAILTLLDLYLMQRQSNNEAANTAWLRQLYPILKSASPLLAWTLIYGVLDLTAYHYANIYTHYGATNLWHGFGMKSIEAVTSLGLSTLVFNQIGNWPYPLIDRTICFVVIFAYLLYRARDTPLLLTFILIAVLGFLPAPVAAANHAFSGRFAYLPNLYGAILWSLILHFALRSVRAAVHAFALTLVWRAVLVHAFSALEVDPFITWLCLAAMPVIAWIQYRAYPATKRDCVCIAVLAAGALALLLLDVEFALPWLFIAVGVCYGAGRGGIISGAAAMAMAFLGGPIGILVALISSAPIPAITWRGGPTWSALQAAKRATSKLP